MNWLLLWICCDAFPPDGREDEASVVVTVVSSEARRMGFETRRIAGGSDRLGAGSEGFIAEKVDMVMSVMSELFEVSESLLRRVKSGGCGMATFFSSRLIGGLLKPSN